MSEIEERSRKSDEKAELKNQVKEDFSNFYQNIPEEYIDRKVRRISQRSSSASSRGTSRLKNKRRHANFDKMRPASISEIQGQNFGNFAKSKAMKTAIERQNTEMISSLSNAARSRSNSELEAAHLLQVLLATPR